MPDYAACLNVECNRKNTCCRFLMDWRGVYRQTIIMPPGNGDECTEYWPLSAGAPFKLKKVDEYEKAGKSENVASSVPVRQLQAPADDAYPGIQPGG